MGDAEEDELEGDGVRRSGLVRSIEGARQRDFEDVLSRLTDRVPDDVLIGALVGDRYRVLSRVAKGGMGRIYAAEHRTLGTRVAVKTLRIDTVPTEAVERFRREARAAARLRSPHIVQVHDFGELPDGSLYLVMEMLLGEDLGKLLARERRLPPERALRILQQIASALDTAHAQGFVHRDLKPENIFLVTDVVYEDLVKVLDFGIAKGLLQSTGSLTEAGAVLGTPGFLPPEQAISGEGHAVTPASDVYSLAAVALEMLTSRLPYEGDRAIDVLKAMLHAPPRLPSQLGVTVPGLDAVFAKALAREPGDRYPTASDFVAALGAVLFPDASPENIGLRRMRSSMPPAILAPRDERRSSPDAVTLADRPAEPLVETTSTPQRGPWIAAALAGLAAGVALGYLLF